MKKGCLIGLGLFAAFVVFIAVILIVVFSLTGGAVDSADAFLALLGQGKTAEAYAQASSVLRSQQDQDSFAAAVEHLGLTGYSSSSWSSRNVQNDQATLEGSVQTRDGGTIPLTVHLVKEGGAWKVVSIDGPEAGVATTPTSNQPEEPSTGLGGSPAAATSGVPPEAELRRMALASLLDLNRAVQIEDFHDFYDNISELWQQQTNPAALQNAFQVFIDNQIDFGGIAQVQASWDSIPAINSDGVLELKGHYPTQPSQVHFELGYIAENGVWKLFSISANLQ